MCRSVQVIRLSLFAASLLVPTSSIALADDFPWKVYAQKTDDWFRGEEGARITANVLSHQSDRGDWPKNIDTSEKPYRGDRTRLAGTFDNGATIGEIRFLARAYLATDQPRHRDAFLKALDHVISAQYPSGGWPQTFPPGKNYPRHITFNDNTMVNILELMRDVSRSDEFRFVDQSRRAAAGRAFEAGIRCILNCQVKVGGRPTAWCAQHDEKTLEPRGARSYELPSLSGMESAGVLMLLMSLENPGPDVIRSVQAGARWFESARLEGSASGSWTATRSSCRTPTLLRCGRDSTRSTPIVRSSAVATA